MRRVPSLLLLSFGICGCGGPVADPMVQARDDLAADLSDGVLREGGRVVAISDARITSTQPVTFGTVACPLTSVVLGVLCGLLVASNFAERGTPGRTLLVPLYVGAPTALGVAFGAWTCATSDVTVDLQARTVTRTTRWLVGVDRDEVRALDDVSCTTKEEVDADHAVTGCSVRLAAREGLFAADWTLLSYLTCPPAEALCEHLTAKVQATTPEDAP